MRIVRIIFRSVVTALHLLLSVACGYSQSSLSEKVTSFAESYCISCHQGQDANAGFNIESLLQKPLADSSDGWERAVKQIRARQMPPVEAERPDEDEYRSTLQDLVQSLDNLAANNPKTTSIPTIRRLTRLEYRNAIRDLFDLDISVENLLPADEASHGFDNVNVNELTPSLLNRYVSAAERISRLATGRVRDGSWSDTIRLKPDITQEEHLEGLPFGTRGGCIIDYTFPVEGEYDIQVRLTRDRNEQVEGLTKAHTLEVLVDGECKADFEVKPPKGGGHDHVDKHLKQRISVSAGQHQLGVTFRKLPSSVLETKRQPYAARYNTHRHPRTNPAVYQVTIVGPFGKSTSELTPSQRRIYIERPESPAEFEGSASRILSSLLRRAYRRPVSEMDLAGPMDFFRRGLEETQTFEGGIEAAISAILVSPHFLFRIESEAPANEERSLSHYDLASRLSFFLWSSIPDEELLSLADTGQLSQAEILVSQVRRMLQDQRACSLTESFADQWLYLRNLEAFSPDLRLFPDFDDNLRQAFRRETENCFEKMVREDQSILDLLRSPTTFVNGRLAKHYGLPYIYGDQFREVNLEPDVPRGGLLRQGSILTVTSYATRTSPVIRGHWILKNLLGMAPPPPPADVPALKENSVSAELPIRERLAEHRANKACASCHRLMDPLGLSLENFDAIGRWREKEFGAAIEPEGTLPDGSKVRGIQELENYILARPELYATTFTERLMTYAMGRGVEYSDAPTIRNIVSRAPKNNYRFSEIVIGIVLSPAFLR
jgi:hypothetical protein